MSWRSSRLGDVCTLKRGYDLPEHRRAPGIVPIVSSSGITGHHDHSKVAGPGVVTGRYGTLGGVYYLAEDFWPLNTALYVEDFRGNHPRFIQYLLEHALRGVHSNKAAVPGVNRSELHELAVRIPELATQRRIAGILSAYDELGALNEKRMALLERGGRLIYRRSFAAGRPGVKQKIGDLAECIGGGTPSTSIARYWEGGDITWVTPTDVTRNRYLVLLDSEKKITAEGLAHSSAKLVPAHAILMTSRASVGYFAITGREVCTNQGFISIVPHQPRLSPYLLFHLSERVEEIRALGSGSTYPEVSRGKFRELSVLIPPKKLLAAFAELAAPVLDQIRVLKKQNLKLRAARDLLLPRLLSGQLEATFQDLEGRSPAGINT